MSYNSDLQSNNAELVQILASVNALPDAGGELELPELTNPGTSADLLTGKQLIDGDGIVITGEMPENTMDDVTINGNQISIPEGYYPGGGKIISTPIQSNPSISVNANGLITASMELKAGYVSASTKQSTKQLTTQSAKTVTPTKSAQTAVASGRYTTGAIQVAAIPDQYQDVTPVTATAEDVAAGKVFVDASGAVVTGTAEVGGGSSGELTGIFFYDENLTEGRMTKCKVNGVTSIANYTAYTNAVLDEIEINLYSNPQTGSYISSTAFYNCPRVTKITFKSKVDNIHNRAFYNVGTAQACVVNVPWAEGEVAAAPWGLTTATINYNYTGE